MKKDSTKTIIKNARKTARKELEVNLKAHIKEVISSLGYESKKTTKEITKVSKQLARRLSEIIRVDKSVNKQVSKTPPAVEAEPLQATFSTPQPLHPEETAKEKKADNDSNSNKKPVVSKSEENKLHQSDSSTVELLDRLTEAANR